MERRVPLTIRHPWAHPAHLHKEASHILRPHACRQVERGGVVCSWRGEVAAKVPHGSKHPHLTSKGGAVDGKATIRVRSVRVGPSEKQHLKGPVVAVLRSQVSGGRTSVPGEAAVEVDVGASLNQEPDDGHVALGGGVVEGGATRVGLVSGARAVHLGAAGQCHRYPCRVACRGLAQQTMLWIHLAISITISYKLVVKMVMRRWR